MNLVVVGVLGLGGLYLLSKRVTPGQSNQPANEPAYKIINYKDPKTGAYISKSVPSDSEVALQKARCASGSKLSCDWVKWNEDSSKIPEGAIILQPLEDP